MKTNSITRRSLGGVLLLGLLLTQNMIGQPSLPPIPGGTNTSYTTNNYYYPYVPTPSFSYPTSATLLWQLPLNYMCAAPPVVGPDGTIYVLSDKSYGWQPNHNLWAVNPDGTIKWQTTIMTTSSAHPYTMALDVSGTLYVPGANGLYAINSVDGTTNWMVNIGGQGAAIATNGTIYICPNKVYAISNGVIVWDSGTNAPGGNSVLPVVAADGTIYILTATYLFAFNPDGSLKLHTPPPTPTSYFAGWPAIGSDGTVYSSGYHFFCAINPTDGTFKWIYTGTSDQAWEQVPEIGPDGTIYDEAFGNTNKFGTMHLTKVC